MSDEQEETLRQLLKKLSEIALKGPIRTTVRGDTGVGMTLLGELGIENTSMNKSNFRGIVVTARRRAPAGTKNRVNLFAQVPDWSVSACKSSREIAERYGYDYENGNCRRLYCTSSAQHVNAQGLILEVDHGEGHLNELFVADGVRRPVATWRMIRLCERLRRSLPASVWVRATSLRRNGEEFFHYRECLYTGPARVEELAGLLEAGTVTIDHLIEKRDGRTNEKGPLFKMKPSNFDLLFPPGQKYDLLSSRWAD